MGSAVDQSDRDLLDLVYGLVDAEVEEISRQMSDSGFTRKPTARGLRARLEALLDVGPPFFARLDFESGESFYVGRINISDSNGDPIVINWQAERAAAYYSSTVENPMGLHSKTHFEIRDRQIVSAQREVYALDDADGGAMTAIPDSKLADIEMRQGAGMRMSEIAGRIRKDQFEAISHPPDEPLLVVGAPGTGKTAVGLHRLAYIMYGNADLRESPLVVGPNPGFLSFIKAVLPALAHTAEYSTAAGLHGGAAPARSEELDLERLKGDPRMATLIAAAVDNLKKVPSEPLVVRLPRSRVTLDVETLRSIFEDVDARGKPHNDKRADFRYELRRHIENVYRDRVGSHGPSRGTAISDLTTDVMRASDLMRLVSSTWPSISAQALVRDLLGRARTLDQLGASVFRPDELELLYRAPAPRLEDEEWTFSDLPLLDEAEALLSGVSAGASYVVLDEAQDLSPMELRSVARRIRKGAVTVMGDLPQATGEWAYEAWEEVFEHLVPGQAEGFERVGLSIGYRVPQQILEIARRILAVAAPHEEVPEGVWYGSDTPRRIECEPRNLVETVVQSVKDLASLELQRQSGGELTQPAGDVTDEEPDAELTAVVTPSPLVGPVVEAFRSAGIRVARFDEDGIGDCVTVLRGIDSKGLEFDNVVIVEPSAVMQERTLGHNVLYVAMTRAMKRLRVVHSEPLPPVLGDWTADPQRLADVESPTLDADRGVYASLVADDIQAYVASMLPQLPLDDLVAIYHLVRRLSGAPPRDLD